jgi:hypothetical protein
MVSGCQTPHQGKQAKTCDGSMAVITDLFGFLLAIQSNDTNVTIMVCHEISLIHVSKEVVLQGLKLR